MSWRTWPRWKLVLLSGCSLVGVLALGLAGVLGWVAWSSHRAVERFDALSARVTPGTPLATLLADPALSYCAGVRLTGDFVGAAESPPATEAQLEAMLTGFRNSAAALSGTGQLELMWYSLPPFGRLFLHVEYAGGQVRAARTSALD